MSVSVADVGRLHEDVASVQSSGNVDNENAYGREREGCRFGLRHAAIFRRLGSSARSTGTILLTSPLSFEGRAYALRTMPRKWP